MPTWNTHLRKRCGRPDEGLPRSSRGFLILRSAGAIALAVWCRLSRLSGRGPGDRRAAGAAGRHRPRDRSSTWGPKPLAIPTVEDPRSWEVFRQPLRRPAGQPRADPFPRRHRAPAGARQGRRGSAAGPARGGPAGPHLRPAAGDPAGHRPGGPRSGSQSVAGHSLTGEFLQDCEAELRLPDLEKRSSSGSARSRSRPCGWASCASWPKIWPGRPSRWSTAACPRTTSPATATCCAAATACVFRFVGATSDQKAWIVEQVGQPLTTYYPVADRDEIFVGLVESRAGQQLPVPR